MPKQTDLAALAARVADLEERLAVIERTPMVAHHVSQHRAWLAQRKREVAEERRAAEAYAAAEPQRRKHFKQFTADRLVFGPACRTIDEFAYMTYIAWADEVKLPKVERFTLEGFLTAMLTQPHVKRGVVRSYIGGKVDGLIGIAVAEQYRNERDAHQDELLEKRLTRDEMLAGMTDDQRADHYREQEILATAPGR
jgi:hypothetical protein